MYLKLNSTEAQTMIATATNRIGTLTTAVIEFVSVMEPTKKVTLNKTNLSASPERYDQFEILPGDYASMPIGDFEYTIKSDVGGDIDSDLVLEIGRGTIVKSIIELKKQHVTSKTRKSHERK
jgi:hypothetical protein